MPPLLKKERKKKRKKPSFPFTLPLQKPTTLYHTKKKNTPTHATNPTNPILKTPKRNKNKKNQQITIHTHITTHNNKT
jgi:hypothetical protein